MVVLRIVLVAFVVFIIQITFVHDISIAGCSPDLMVILLVVLVLGRSPIVAVIIGFALGFLRDLGNASYLGMNALAQSIVAYGTSHIGGRFFPESTFYKGFLICVAAMIKDLVVLAVTTSFSLVEIFISFIRYSILTSLYTAIIGVVVLMFVNAFTGRVVRPGGVS